MRVAFLDFDGVFTATARSFLAGSEYDPIAAKLLNRAFTEFDYKIVVSSTWRIGASDLELATYLKLMGFKPKLFNFNNGFMTPRLQKGCRGDEIAKWLSEHPEVTDYIIIDDDCDMLPEQMDHLIHCDNREGFGARQYFEIKDRHHFNESFMTYDFHPKSNVI
jgi:hypothetical protein